MKQGFKYVSARLVLAVFALFLPFCSALLNPDPESLNRRDADAGDYIEDKDEQSDLQPDLAPDITDQEEEIDVPDETLDEDPVIEELDVEKEDEIVEEILDATDDGNELCTEEELIISRVIPDALILLERSNNMSEPTANPLWTTIREAIITMTAVMEESIWFGLMAFPNSKEPNVCTGYNNQCRAPTLDGWNVPISETTTALDIETALMSLTTCGGSPTAVSLESAGQYLLTLTDDHPKYIILASAGAPNCNDALDGSTCTCTAPTGCLINNLNCLDDVRTFGVLINLCSNGIKTYVIGTGESTDWTDVLNQMAISGCTDAPFVAEDPESIQAALHGIACQFKLNCADIPDSSKVNFYFDGETVPKDTTHTNGWDWIDPCESISDESGIIGFYGVQCDMIISSDIETVSATFGCPTIVI